MLGKESSSFDTIASCSSRIDSANTNTDPSYLDRTLAAARGEATGMFQVVIHGIGGVIGDPDLDRQSFENMGTTLYGNSILADDF
jgi:hypothetical protein